MAIICNLRSQSLQREYTVIDASLGYASVELRNPSASENPAAFEVEAGEITNVRVITDTGEMVDYPDYLRCERSQRDDDYGPEYNYPGALM